MSRHSTKHGKMRVARRMNVNKRRAESVIKRALTKGIKQNETLGALNKYITKIYFKNRKASDIRIYNDFIFLFDKGILITAWELPNELKGEQYIKQSEEKKKSLKKTNGHSLGKGDV